VSDSDLSVDPVLEPATPEPVPAEPVAVPEPVAVEPAPVPEIPAPEPQPVDATGQPIPTPEPTPEPEVVTPGLAMAAPAYKPPAADFEHTAFNPEDVQNIS
jgi:hypothetical protein